MRTASHHTQLREISLLASLRPDDASRLLDAARRFSVAEEPELLFDVSASAARVYVVLQGRVRLEATPRGEVDAIVLRTVLRGEALGLEAAFGAHTRHVRAIATPGSELLELPAELLARSIRRSNTDEARGLERAVRRKLTEEQLRTMAFTRALPERERTLLLDMVRRRHTPRGASIYHEQQRGMAMYLLASGMVRLFHTVDGERHIRAYLSAGDFFGETEALSGERYRLGAEAVGPCELLVVPRQHLLTLTARNPGLLERMQRIAFQRETTQSQAFSDTASTPDRTQHLFHDIYRAALATELLAIDLDTCVTCGTCAWSCHQTHGQSRLVRRGDKVVAPAGMQQLAAGSRLLLPNSCQHCRDPECMIDCPTGAIGRDPEGEVFIRNEICTGCEACAKACPWDNIQIAPAASESAFSQVAIKCDLCRGHGGVSACVANCPTGAITRIHPAAESATLSALLGAAPTSSNTAPAQPRRSTTTPVLLAAATLLLATAGVTGHARGALAAFSGAGLWSGVLAAVAMLALVSFGLRKRLLPLWMRRVAKPAGDETPRKIRPLSVWYRAHLMLGAGLVAALMLHTGGGVGGPLTRALMLALTGSVVIGGLGAVLYRILPRRMARVVAHPHLPEDEAAEVRRLELALRSSLEGRERARSRVETTLAPLMSSPGEALRVLFRGEDRHTLRERYEALVLGEGSWDVAQRHALEKSARIATERVGLRAERWGQRLLAATPLPHVLCSLVALVLMLVHAARGLAYL